MYFDLSNVDHDFITRIYGTSKIRVPPTDEILEAGDDTSDRVEQEHEIDHYTGCKPSHPEECEYNSGPGGMGGGPGGMGGGPGGMGGGPGGMGGGPGGMGGGPGGMGGGPGGMGGGPGGMGGGPGGMGGGPGGMGGGPGGMGGGPGGMGGGPGGMGGGPGGMGGRNRNWLDDPTIFWLVHHLRRNENLAVLKDKFITASTLSCPCCAHEDATNYRRVLEMFDVYAGRLGVQFNYFCPIGGHDRPLASEKASCIDCDPRKLPKRGTTQERHRLVSCDVTQQVIMICGRELENIINLHSLHHNGGYVNTRNIDYETRYSDRFRVNMEDLNEFQQNILNVQIVPSADAFRLANSSTGSPWAGYALLWDAPLETRFLPSNMITIGVYASGNLAKPSDDRLDTLMVRLSAEAILWQNRLYPIQDANGVIWYLRLTISGSLLDAEAAFDAFDDSR